MRMFTRQFNIYIYIYLYLSLYVYVYITINKWQEMIFTVLRQDNFLRYSLIKETFFLSSEI